MLKKIISVKLAISYYGTPLALLWDTFGPVMGRDFGPSMEQISVPTMEQMYILYFMIMFFKNVILQH